MGILYYIDMKRMTYHAYHPTAHSNFRIREEHWTDAQGETKVRFEVQINERAAEGRERWRHRGLYKPTLEAAQREVESVRKRIEGGKTGYQNRKAPK
jgi:hypothetical protein